MRVASEKNLQKQYMEMAQSIETMQEGSEKLKETLGGIYTEIKNAIELSYENKRV